MPAHLGDAPRHRLVRQPEMLEQAAAELQARFDRFRHHRHRAELEQLRRMRRIDRPREHRGVRPPLAGGRHHALGRARRIDGDDEGAGVRRARAIEELAAAGIAEIDSGAALAVLAHQLAVAVERDERHVLGLEHPGDRLADAPIAADHHVAGELAGARPRHVLAVREVLQTVTEPAAAPRPQRCRHHAEADHRGGDLRRLRRQDLGETAEGDDHEGEFAALRQQN